MSGLQQSRNRRAGEAVEQVAAHRLVALGVLQVCAIDVGWRIQRRPGGAIIGASPKAKVAGDLRGVLPGGRSVLVECKRTAKASLPYSQLEHHQHQRLTDHAEAGGLSLVAWSWPGGIALLRYPIPGFAPRTSVSVDVATALNLSTLPKG